MCKDLPIMVLEEETERGRGCVLVRLCTKLSKNIHGSKFVKKVPRHMKNIKNIVLYKQNSIQQFSTRNLKQSINNTLESRAMEMKQ